MIRSGRIELLAPAGNLSSALAAYDAGADAVYAGMKHFNARERGENFTDESLARLCAYAHRHGKKLYVTFNTVVKESEISVAAEALAALDYIQPDALIVQDIGVVRMIREFFPRLRIHGSTQMALHDSSSLETAFRMGLSRVILERQIALEELRLITERSPVELEVFVHGALCCCLSGTCLFSSWLGGSSGNRGQCKQPCRRMFRSGSGRSGFYFSTRDLAAFPLIPEFRKMGIASIKIEGRLRNADYVSAVTGAYRLVLDAPDSDFKEACREAAARLAETASRKSSLGFYTARSAAELVHPESSGAIGREVGRIVSSGKGFFDASLSGRIHVGDSLRIQNAAGDEGKTFTLIGLSVNGENVMKASSGGQCRIACPDHDIPYNGILYKVGESFGSMEKRIAGLPPYKPGVDFEIGVSSSGFYGKYAGYHWKFPAEFQPAKTHPLDEKHLAESFSAPGDLALSEGRVTTRAETGLFVPASVMKEARRNFWDWLSKQVSPASIREACHARAEKLLAEHAAFHFTETGSPAKTVLTGTEGGIVLPFFTPETDLPELKEEIRSRIKMGERVFRVTSLSHFALLKEFSGLTLKVMPPIPIANSFAVREAESLGAASAVIHIELGREDMFLLAKRSDLPLETYCFGRPVIFATRAHIAEMDSFSELHGTGRFLIRRQGGLNVILPETPVRIPCVPGTAELVDLRNCTEAESVQTSVFNYDRGLK